MPQFPLRRRPLPSWPRRTRSNPPSEAVRLVATGSAASPDSTMSEFFHPLLQWVSAHPLLAGVTVFVVAMAESLAIVGMVVPGVAMMFAFGALISAGALTFASTAAWAVAGAVLGDGLSFLIGRHFRDRLASLWPFNRHPQILERGVGFFQRYGGKSVFLGRFVGPIRAVIPLVAGMFGMQPLRFFLANLFSALAWAPAYLLPGMLFGASLELASEVALRLVILLIVLAGLLVFVFWVIKRSYRLIHTHASDWLARLLVWSELHPKLGTIAAALADPDHPEAKGLAIFASLLLLSTALFVVVFAVALDGGSAGVDGLVLEALQGLRTPWADELLLVLGRFGDAWVVIPVVCGIALVLAAQRHWRTLNYWFAAAAFGLLASVVLKYSLRIPRPDVGIAGLGPYAFPSAHVLRAVVVYGFLSVMIARAASMRWRWLPYSLAGLVVAGVALSRLYLGAHWLSDVIGSLALGLAWVAGLGVAYHRHTHFETRWQSLAAAAVALTGVCVVLQTGLHQRDDLERYVPQRPPLELSASGWWNNDWRKLRRTQLDVRQRGSLPLPLQYAGPLEALAKALEPRGWQRAENLKWSDLLKLLSPSLPLQALPVLPRVHDSQHEDLILTKAFGKGRRLVLRVWPAGAVLLPGKIPVWLGSVTIQERASLLGLLSYSRTLGNFARPFQALLKDLDGLRLRQPAPGEALVLVAGNIPEGAPSGRIRSRIR